MAESAPSYFQIEQSLPICCALAFTGGMLEVAATACTAAPSVRAAQSAKQPWWGKYLALAGNVTLQLVGSLMSHLVATWFGPVSMVVPFFYSSTLLCNMLIFGALLGLEFFTKTAKTGTLVIVVAVILLPVVGPSAQEGQEIGRLMSHWYASLWFALLLVVMTVAGILILTVDISKRFSQRNITLILLSARASSIAINLTVSKGFVSNPSQFVFLLFLVLKIVSGGIYTYAIVVQSTAIEKQSHFMPLNTTTIITVNAITGILIWEDYLVISSWYGYACVFALMGLGCDLLLGTDVPLLNEDNPDFGVHRRATFVVVPGHAERRRSSMWGLGGISESIEEEEEEEEEEDEEEGTIDKETDLLIPYDKGINGEATTHMRRMSRRDAWKDIIGVPQTATSQKNRSANTSYRALVKTSSNIANATTSAISKTSSGVANATSTAISKTSSGVASAATGVSSAATAATASAARSLKSSAGATAEATKNIADTTAAATKAIASTGGKVIKGVSKNTAHATASASKTAAKTRGKVLKGVSKLFKKKEDH